MTIYFEFIKFIVFRIFVILKIFIHHLKIYYKNKRVEHL